MKIKLFLISLVSLFLVGCLPDDKVYANTNEFKVVTVFEMANIANEYKRSYDYLYIVRDGSPDGEFVIYSDINYSVGDILSFEIKESAVPTLEK